MRPSAALLLLVLAGCATPVAPTGGPADTTPPTLVASSPADGSTNVSDRTLRLTFSERLATNAATAVTVTPPTETPPDVSVSARELRITLHELRDSTTYVVTVGTALADQRNVALRAPITLAFATGDAIDRGRIAGTVRRPETGAGVGGVAVWAYALDDTLGTVDPGVAAPDYRTETGADGPFTLEYLRPGPYFVLAIEDRNRNARADAGERFAAPPAPALLARDDSTAPEPAAFFVTTLDTVPPVAQRLRPLSDRRVALRFDEPVRLLDTAAFGEAVAVTDSASGDRRAVSWYQPAASAFEVYGEAAPPFPSTPLLVTSEGTDALADSAGLGAPPFRLSATPPVRADTASARFDAFVPSAPDSVVLGRDVRPGIRFTSPPGALLDAVEVRAVGETLDVPFVTTDGVTFVPDSSATLPARFTVVAPVGDSTASQRFVVPDARDLGALVGRVEADGPVRVEVRPEAGAPVVVAADSTGAFVADGLLPGPYTLRIWVDRDGDGRWSGGRLWPYEPPEPLVFLAQPVQVRARWETEIDPITL
ncbi:Ig-like domain-containing protein [Rubrivirga marina]|uniref:SbsA Ig-like domain-containing protein n=1 Tax=Rubrivirga marina TaxID=1196024 RepID=A0A271J0P2_9BACT|nr:Ig-like domain-containing protein [Rubrivirga marina]PAP77023.1 hypothetical protein BSZ37_11555 [Rubrivirga marina]